MDTSILLGNGINRSVISNISWNDLLKSIAKEYNVVLNENLSFPMQFETIVNQILKSNSGYSEDIYYKIKSKIAETLLNANLNNDLLQKKFTDNVSTIITTNYDYLIEKSIDNNFNVNDYNKHTKNHNNRYNINNSLKVNGKEIFHIHGDVRNVNSICLGYEHYSGTLQHLRKSINKKTKDNSEPAIIRSLRNPEFELNSWASKFFTDNIHIIGLGLTKSEIDLWWLITYRAYLLYTNRYDSKALIKNKIIFHDIKKDVDSDMKFTLENSAIEYEFHKIESLDNNEQFFSKYLEIADNINNI